MLALSTYLGHATVADTYWYLEATPDLMRSIAECCERSPKEGGHDPYRITHHGLLSERLPVERHVSENTCDSYAYAFKLLFEYASDLKVRPSELCLEHLDEPLIVGFLSYLEAKRGNGANSRNIRLAAIRSFMRFMEYRVPTALEQIRRVLAIPTKKTDSRLVKHLSVEELQAILDAPSPSKPDGIRDRAMMHLCFAGGLRVSELVGLRLNDLAFNHRPAYCSRQRSAGTLPPFVERNNRGVEGLVGGKILGLPPELFINARGQAMTRAGFEYILHKHAKQRKALSLAINETHFTACAEAYRALIILQATKDLRQVSLWLGHANMQTTEMYTRADPSVKLEALESVVAPKLRSGRFKATDKLIASLKTQTFMRRQ